MPFWSHRHVYKVTDNIEYSPILGDPIGEYVCRCGGKMKVYEDGEVLAIWPKDSEGGGYFAGTEVVKDGEIKFVTKHVTDFDIIGTTKIRDNDIYNK